MVKVSIHIITLPCRGCLSNSTFVSKFPPEKGLGMSNETLFSIMKSFTKDADVQLVLVCTSLPVSPSQHKQETGETP